MPTELPECAVRTLLQTQIEDHKRAHAREHELLENTRVESRAELAVRLESMNEFRRQLEHAEASFISREEWAASREALSVRINAVFDSADSRFRVLERLVYIGVGASAVIGAALHFVK